ncbi:MAG: V-type ATP synthase subunit E family protein [Synergistaceae bacterium]|nr:V-type ATP synthase subunit E family protein [Synergistaceae bacterium]
MKEVSSEKIGTLRDIILDKADSKKKELVAGARQEAEEWMLRETEKLQRETNLILQDARKRAEDIRRRQILSAEREKSTEALRLQNRILSEALGRLQDRLVHLREREDYIDIIAGMCIDAKNSLRETKGLKLRLSAVDMGLADSVISKVLKLMPDAEMTFDPETAPILGGCWISTNDGRRQVNSDWQSLTQEMADTLAERLLPLL